MAPKLLGVRTRPWPKWCCQIRLTMTRAVRGLAGSIIAWASSNRPLPWEKGVGLSPAITRRNWRGTFSPGWTGSPWMATGISSAPPSTKVWTCSGTGGRFFFMVSRVWVSWSMTFCCFSFSATCSAGRFVLILLALPMHVDWSLI